ncbi:Uncharacterised protein [Mycobacteroides abscessus subsp. abscessus]|nr:Uncharacterised protein [Mycobacteroides abscessus subsp. abscessus]
MHRIDQRHEFGPLGLGGQQIEQPLGGPAALAGSRRKIVDEPFELVVGVAHGVGVDEMLGQLARQAQHHLGDGSRGLVGVQPAREVGHHAKSQLPHLGFGDQPGGGLDGQQQAVLAQQGAGEGVIGTDGGVLVGQRDAGQQTRTGEAGQPGAHAAQQLAGGLASEGQAEDL